MISIVSEIKYLKSDDSLFALLKTQCITFLGVIANIKFVFPLFFVLLKRQSFFLQHLKFEFLE